MATQKPTTIKIHVETKEYLEALRSYPKESLNDVIKRLIDIVCYIPEDEGQTDLDSFDKGMK